MISEILNIASAAATIVETQVQRAERNETMDIGALKQTAADLKALHEKLLSFKNAAEAVASDADFAQLVLDFGTRPESD